MNRTSRYLNLFRHPERLDRPRYRSAARYRRRSEFALNLARHEPEYLFQLDANGG